MDFVKLKLKGFKSFVDSAPLVIEPGLTGVVGPNGCGKSNLLEALRWVMGASSAKALRGAEMDDVIFSGAKGKNAYNWAEVSLTIDNHQKLAPAPFKEQPLIEVTRRIYRQEGSTYLINSKEVRAKDVQLLFADASTGANSPALVRQGQIAELISAKPQNRRRVLEEAAGISGLAARRAEAEFRLNNADSNLAKLEVLNEQYVSQLTKLKKEARQAEKYKSLSKDIRDLSLYVWYKKYETLLDQTQQAQEAYAEAEQAFEQIEQSVKEHDALIEQAKRDMIPIKEEAAICLQLTTQNLIDFERLEAEKMRLEAELGRLENDIKRIQKDQIDLECQAEDASLQILRLIARLKEEDVHTEDETKDALFQLLDALKISEADYHTAEENYRKIDLAKASDLARQRSEEQRKIEKQHYIDKISQQIIELERIIDKNKRAPSDEIKKIEEMIYSCENEIDKEKKSIQHLDHLSQNLEEKIEQTRETLNHLSGQITEKSAESNALKKILTASKKDQNAVLDHLKPKKGYELALAAALGDDLYFGFARLDCPQAIRFWCENISFDDELIRQDLPEGCLCLSNFIEDIPHFMTARLTSIGLVDRALGDGLQTKLKRGQRLVSIEGDLWRWDGVIVRARAPKPAAIRLSQRNRLNDLDLELEGLKPLFLQTQEELSELLAQRRVHLEQLETQKNSLKISEKNLKNAQKTSEELFRAQTEENARLKASHESLERFIIERQEAELSLQSFLDECLPSIDWQIRDDLIIEAKKIVDDTKAKWLNQKAFVDQKHLAKKTKEKNKTLLNNEYQEWVKRNEAISFRLEALKKQDDAIKKQEESVRQALPILLIQRDKHKNQSELLQNRHQAVKAKRSVCETRLKMLEEEYRRFDTEKNAHLISLTDKAARLSSLKERFEQLKNDILAETGRDSAELKQGAEKLTLAVPPLLSGAEKLLKGLMAERETLGPVNLCVEAELEQIEEKSTLLSIESNDLRQAIQKLRQAIEELNSEGRSRLNEAFAKINTSFRALFSTLFSGGDAHLELIDSDDPLNAGLEIFACPPGKKLARMSLMSGGEQALTATALVFAVFLANPAPLCVLDEVDAPLDDVNVDRYCCLLDEMRHRTKTRFLVITHNPVTMARMDRLFGVTMSEPGVSRLLSVTLKEAKTLIDVAIAC